MPFIPMHLHPPAIHENVNKLAHNERPSQVVTHVRESGVRSLYKAKASLSEALGVHSSKPVGPNLGLPSDAPTKTVYHSVESPLSEANASQATSDIARAKTLVNDLADVVNKVNSLSESSKFPQITNAKEKISVLKSLLNELQEVQTQLDIITSEKEQDSALPEITSPWGRVEDTKDSTIALSLSTQEVDHLKELMERDGYKLQDVTSLNVLVVSGLHAYAPSIPVACILPREEETESKIKPRTPKTPFTKNHLDSSEKMPKDNSTTERRQNFLSCW